jgi:16S rRNA (cytidine1402-2'-O)-methyltransferase
MQTNSIVYLFPSLLDEAAVDTISAPYYMPYLRNCEVFFVENERSARRFLKTIWKEMVIDDYEWHTIHKAEAEVQQVLRQCLKAGKKIGIISEAGCPGVADPGQLLVETAQLAGATVKPLVGPSSILLALMASGMNGQCFRFNGYLPIDAAARMKALKEIEINSAKNNCTEIFIETPYRNNQLVETLLKTCKPGTRLCIAADITGPNEWIKTMKVEAWKQKVPELHKRPVIFCLLAG